MAMLKTTTLTLALTFGLAASPVIGQERTVDAPEAPDLGPANQTEDGIAWHDVAEGRTGHDTRLWVYLPENTKRGDTPCVVIAPAGSSLCHGMGLAEGDQPEHLPWVAAGFVVVAYEIEGPWPEDESDSNVADAVRQFVQADAGVANGKSAVSFALSLREVDPKRVFTAGHSSAATLALQLVAADPRLCGCVAFAPAVDIVQHFGDDGRQWLDGFAKGASKTLFDRSPMKLCSKLEAPVFLFAAEDDQVIAADAVAGFAAELGRTNRRVTLLTVPEGGHYQSMIDAGLPNAIEWFRGGMRAPKAERNDKEDDSEKK